MSQVVIFNKVAAVQANQWYSVDTQALVFVWQASETQLSKTTFGSGVVVIT